MRAAAWFTAATLLAACASAAVTPSGAATLIPVEPALQNYGPAPELAGTVWLNVPQPLHLADLRGQVVLLDMWTFG